MDTISDSIETKEAAKSKVNFRAIGRVLWKMFLGVAVVFFLAGLANMAWIASGSGEWELEFERDGAKIYSLKEPGSGMKKFKGIDYSDLPLTTYIVSLLDMDIGENHCDEWMPGCTKFVTVEPWDPVTGNFSQLWRFELFPPFAEREMVVTGRLHPQDTQTGEVFFELIGAQNKVRSDTCCVRVVHFHNSWRYTPMDDGRLRIEFIQDFDLGGLFPDILLNLMGAEQVFVFLHEELPLLINQEKYRNSKLDFIRDYK